MDSQVKALLVILALMVVKDIIVTFFKGRKEVDVGEALLRGAQMGWRNREELEQDRRTIAAEIRKEKRNARRNST